MAITAAKIASNAVETAKIKNLAVTTVKIANGAVTDVKIESVAASKVTGLATVATSGLSSTSTTAALSAYQGKVLNDKIADLGFKTGSISGVTNATLKKQGKLVIGYVEVANAKSTLFTLPEGFRPNSEVSAVYGTQTYNSSKRLYEDIQTTLTFKTSGAVTSSKNGNLSGTLKILFGFESA